MGIGGPATSFLSVIHKHGLLEGKSSVMEIGAQDFNNAFESFIYDFPHDVPIRTRILSNEEKKIKLVSEMYKKIGLMKYKSIDTNGHNNSLVLDMNKDLVNDYDFNDQFDLVTNFGTTEHISNQYQIFKNMHDLCKINGLMIGIVPFQGALNHGFFNYQPLFFQYLALANKYDMNLYWTIASPQLYTHNILPVDFDNEVVQMIRNAVREKMFSYIPYEMEEQICYVFKKKNNNPFVNPDDSYSGNNGQRISYDINKIPRVIDNKINKEEIFAEWMLFYGRSKKVHFLNSLNNFKNDNMKTRLKKLFRFKRILNIFKAICK